MADSDVAPETTTAPAEEAPAEEQEEVKTYTLTRTDADGNELTSTVSEDELASLAAGLLETESVTISADESRQIRQYESNKYFMSAKVVTAGLPALIRSVDAEPEMKKRANQVILNQLVLKIRGVFGFIKRNIHEQQRIDGIQHIDYRPGEKQ